VTATEFPTDARENVLNARRDVVDRGDRIIQRAGRSG